MTLEKNGPLGQIIEIPTLAAQGFRFKFLLFHALPHDREGSGERLQALLLYKNGPSSHQLSENSFNPVSHNFKITNSGRGGF